MTVVVLENDLYSETGPCPACGESWQAGRIPEESRAAGHYGDPETAPTHYSRLIGIESDGHYDGVSQWMCPDCGAKWNRFTGERVSPDFGDTARSSRDEVAA